MGHLEVLPNIFSKQKPFHSKYEFRNTKNAGDWMVLEVIIYRSLHQEYTLYVVGRIGTAYPTNLLRTTVNKLNNPNSTDWRHPPNKTLAYYGE